MRSIGIVFKNEEMAIVSLRDGLNEVFLEGYNILPFMDLKGQEKEEVILKTLDRFLKIHKGARDNIFIALPRDAALIQTISLPIAVEENLRKSLEYEMDHHTPFSPEEIYFDYHVLRRMPESGRLYLMLITVKKELVDSYIRLFQKAKIKLRSIEITSTALFNVFQDTLTPSEKMVDLSWLKNNKVLKERYLKKLIQKSPRVADFFKAEETVTPDPTTSILVEYLDKDQFEINLVDEGTFYYSKSLNLSNEPIETHFCQTHENGLKSLIHLPVKKGKGKEIRFFLSGKEMEKEYVEHAPENIKAAFSVINSFKVRPDKNRKRAATAVLPILSVPIGLALKGLKKTAIDINFLPLNQRLKKKRSKKKMIAAAVPIFLLLLIGYLISNSVNTINLREKALDKELKELKRKAIDVEKLRNSAETIEAAAGAVGKVKTADPSKLKFLEELTLIIPMDGWLSDFSYKASDRKVNLSGYAVSASKLIPILEESRLFENVKFTSPITTDRREQKERFRIEMTVSLEKTKADPLPETNKKPGRKQTTP